AKRFRSCTTQARRPTAISYSVWQSSKGSRAPAEGSRDLFFSDPTTLDEMYYHSMKARPTRNRPSARVRLDDCSCSYRSSPKSPLKNKMTHARRFLHAVQVLANRAASTHP